MTDEYSSVRRILRAVGRVAALPLIGLIRFYQLVISPLTPPTCRYYPSCSSYALTAIQRFGPLKGTWLAARRLLRCHPWTPGGVDHVPERARPASSASATTAYESAASAATDSRTDQRSPDRHHPPKD